MAIFALSSSSSSLPKPNLFAPLPNDAVVSSTSYSPSPPIPVPKYPPPVPKKPPPNPNPKHPALKSTHRNTKYFRPVRPGDVILQDPNRSVVISDYGVSYKLPGAPFEFQFSYSETPKAEPVGIREPAFLPFAPPTMPRPWTGKAPMKKAKDKERKIPLFDSFNPPPPGKKGVKYVEMPGPFWFGRFPKEGKSREEILGERLKKFEIKMLIQPMLSDNRQVNLGRDGLTHNMLELVHSHWKRGRVCKVKCKGVPTVDMDNVCKHVEEKTGGKIIHRVGGVLYLFRGRNYNYRTRPQFPVMLWKPATPVYPKLIQEAPEGLTKEEADELRTKGKYLLPICKLAKNGVYTSLVQDVKDAFEGSPLVRVDCRGLDPSDYKKIGAKLKELVPCVLLSFDDEQILMWRGGDWKSTYAEVCPVSFPPKAYVSEDYQDDSVNPSGDDSPKSQSKTVVLSSKMMKLWKRAIDSSKALVLEEINIGPDDLLKKVEEFESISQAVEHSYSALVGSNEDETVSSSEEFEVDDSQIQNYSEDYLYDDEEYIDEDEYDVDEFNAVVPRGSLPVDRIAEKLKKKRI